MSGISGESGQKALWVLRNKVIFLLQLCLANQVNDKGEYGH